MRILVRECTFVSDAEPEDGFTPGACIQSTLFRIYVHEESRSVRWTYIPWRFGISLAVKWIAVKLNGSGSGVAWLPVTSRFSFHRFMVKSMNVVSWTTASEDGTFSRPVLKLVGLPMTKES